MKQRCDRTRRDLFCSNQEVVWGGRNWIFGSTNANLNYPNGNFVPRISLLCQKKKTRNRFVLMVGHVSNIRVLGILSARETEVIIGIST